jgi:GNAT superfamily N-acetyltransferase
VVDVREIREGQTLQAGVAMLTLRPRWKTAEAVVNFIDNRLRPAGYRLDGVFEDDLRSAVSVIGFRERWATAYGHYLYVDDLSTVVEARGRGYGDSLMRWAIAEALRLDCAALHLDSSVTNDRAPAHRLYMRNHLRITAHHFAVELTPTDSHREHVEPTSSKRSE